MKIKTKLNPSEKIKKRYLLIRSSIKEDIEKVVLDYLGILGWARAKPAFVKKDEGIVLAIDRKMINEVRAAFEMANIKVLKVSGTLEGLGK